jgi:hypothetical protein
VALSCTIQPVTPNRRVTAMEVERRILQRRETREPVSMGVSCVWTGRGFVLVGGEEIAPCGRGSVGRAREAASKGGCSQNWPPYKMGQAQRTPAEADAAS